MGGEEDETLQRAVRDEDPRRLDAVSLREQLAEGRESCRVPVLHRVPLAPLKRRLSTLGDLLDRQAFGGRHPARERDLAHGLSLEKEPEQVRQPLDHAVGRGEQGGHRASGSLRRAMILVTGATGMFGRRTVGQLAARGVPVRALVHSPQHAEELPAEIVAGDMDEPDSLTNALAGVEAVFLISPMDEHIERRERNVLDAAVRAGVGRIVKLHGAVRHRGDRLAQLHEASIEAIKGSGLSWALVSPSSVMETSLLSQAQSIQTTNSMWGCAGDGRVGLVAAEDVARAAAIVLEEGIDDGRNFELTGPEALSLTDVAATMSRVLGRSIAYNDMPEDDFRRVLVEQDGMAPEEAELKVILHFRAWRRGDADLVTETYRELTGEEPTSVATWVAAHRAAFENVSQRS